MFYIIVNVTNSNFVKHIALHFELILYIYINAKVVSLINVSYYPDQKIEKIKSFPVTGGSSTKSATVKTERLANAVSGIILNISPNLESLSVHKSRETMESSSIIDNFTSVTYFFSFRFVV